MFSHFDLLAPIYNRVIEWLMGPSDQELWTELLKLPIDGRLLDAGGGTIRVSTPLCSMVGQLVITDISSGMLRQASKKGETGSGPNQRYAPSFSERQLRADHGDRCPPSFPSTARGDP